MLLCRHDLREPDRLRIDGDGAGCREQEHEGDESHAHSDRELRRARLLRLHDGIGMQRRPLTDALQRLVAREPEHDEAEGHAYAGGAEYDMKYGREGERPAVDQRIGAVPLPEQDPATVVDRHAAGGFHAGRDGSSATD